MNKGPWKRLEEKVRLLVEKYGHAWVMTGPLYENDMPPLPNADETHKVPSGYWKIIVVNDSGNIQVAAFIMEQDVARNSKVIDHLVKVDDVESRSGLDFLWELPDTQEMPIESQLNTAWANEHFK